MPLRLRGADMIRRVRTYSGKKTHAARGMKWEVDRWVGRTFCQRAAWMVVRSDPGAEDTFFVNGNTDAVDCRICRHAVQEIIGNIENVLAGFSS